MMACAAMLIAACVSSNAQVQDRINRGCGGLGGILNQVITDFSGNIFMTPCLNKQVFICNTLGVCTAITAGGPSGSGTAGTIPLWTTSTNLGNSILTQTGTAAVTLGAGSFIYTQVAAPSLSAANFGKVYFDSTSKTLKGSYNGAAYLDFMRGNVGNGFLPVANSTGNTFSSSYAAQSGNDFFVSQASTGIILLGRGGAFHPNLLIDDNALSISGRINTTSVFNLSAGQQTIGTSAALGFFDTAGAAVSLGDVLVTANGTRVLIDDTNNTFRVVGSNSLVSTIESDTTIGLPTGAAQVQTLSGSGVTSFGDVNAQANSSSAVLTDSTQTFSVNLPQPFLSLNGVNATAEIGKVSGAAQGSFDAQNGITILGDAASQGNGLKFTINDTNQQFIFSNLLTCGYLSTDGSGIVNCATGQPALIVASANTASIGGGALLAGACASGTANIPGVSVTDTISATPQTYPGDAVFWKAYMSAANTVTVKVCAAVAATPTASVYGVRAFH